VRGISCDICGLYVNGICSNCFAGTDERVQNKLDEQMQTIDMPYVEMTINSIHHAMHRDEWLILLKDKSGQRCLPVYVDKASADAMGKLPKSV